MQMLQSLEAASVDLGEEAAPLSNQGWVLKNIDNFVLTTNALQ